ncbi:extensin [Ixodes scapularis]|uniref:extensin n=1 Tax=Ixodes scapularis TaxID=6945 RepID=UPI001A9D62F8|nr:extensin [Ixodes scapularis]
MGPTNVLTAWAILLVSVGRPGTVAQQPDQPGGEGAPVVVVTGPIVRVWEPTRGGAPSTVGLPTPHHAYEEEEEERERPPPVFVRAQPVPLSEPQGTGWVPMLPGGGSWLSQPHPPRYPPPTSVGPSTFVFPASRPAYPPAPQQNVPPNSVGAFARARWRGGDPAPYPPPNAIPPATDGATRHLADATPAQKAPSDTNRNDVRLQTPGPFPSTEPTQIRGTTDPTVSFDPTTPADHYAVSPAATTHGAAPNSSSPLRVPDDVLEQRNSRHGDATVGATVGEGVTATPNETATPKVTRTEMPGIESPGYVLSGGAVTGIVIGAVSLLALLAGAATYAFLRHPSLRLLGGRDKSSSENVAYIDDSVRSGYMNAHIELPKENSEEMTSLDNDSFLNSLEAVTIQNYWADATKNTNV